jgi:hypothetical protein
LLSVLASSNALKILELLEEVVDPFHELTGLGVLWEWDVSASFGRHGCLDIDPLHHFTQCICMHARGRRSEWNAEAELPHQ